MTQLVLFEEPVEEKLERKIIFLEGKYDSLRKGQFAKISGLNKELGELKSRLDFLEMNICKGKLLNE